MKIDSSLLEQGRQQYEATTNDSNRQVRDATITPFAFAMKIGGYVAVARQGGCSELRECPFCKGKYSTKYRKGGVVLWGCPHCQEISAEPSAGQAVRARRAADT